MRFTLLAFCVAAAAGFATAQNSTDTDCVSSCSDQAAQLNAAAIQQCIPDETVSDADALTCICSSSALLTDIENCIVDACPDYLSPVQVLCDHLISGDTSVLDDDSDTAAPSAVPSEDGATATATSSASAPAGSGAPSGQAGGAPAKGKAGGLLAGLLQAGSGSTGGPKDTGSAKLDSGAVRLGSVVSAGVLGLALVATALVM